MGTFKVRQGFVFFQAIGDKRTQPHRGPCELELSEKDIVGQEHKLERVNGAQPPAEEERPEIVAHALDGPVADRGEPPKRKRGQRGPNRIHAGE